MFGKKSIAKCNSYEIEEKNETIRLYLTNFFGQRVCYLDLKKGESIDFVENLYKIVVKKKW